MSDVAPEESRLDKLPTDLLCEIILRLPNRTIGMLRCVSKPFNALIAERLFTRKHLEKGPKRLLFSDVWSLLGPESCDLNSLYLNLTAACTRHTTRFYGQKKSVLYRRVVGSCEGLICLVNGHAIKSILVWNPLTRESRILPDLVHQMSERIRFAFGFGYARQLDDYKVVSLVYEDVAKGDVPVDNTGYKMVQVCSLKDGQWRKVDSFPDDILPRGSGYHCPRYCMGKYVEGFICWYFHFRSGTVRKIVSFDLEKEVFGELVQPDYNQEGKGETILEALDSKLFLMWSQDNVHDFWMMKEVGVKSSWTKFASISLHIPHLYPNHIIPLSMANNGDILIRFRDSGIYFLTSTNRLICIDDDSRGIHTKLCDQAVVYVESLVSPRTGWRRQAGEIAVE